MGAAIGSRYRADPAKKMTSAEAKKITTQAVRKSGLRVTHHAMTIAPIPNETQNKGFGIDEDAAGAATTPTIQRARNAQRGQGREDNPSGMRGQGSRVLQLVRKLLKSVAREVAGEHRRGQRAAGQPFIDLIERDRQSQA